MDLLWLVLYVVFGFVILYLVGIPVFLLMARLKRRPDGALVIDHNSWHFQMATLLFTDWPKDSNSYRVHLETAKHMKVSICRYYRNVCLGSFIFVLSVAFFCCFWLFLLLVNILTILVAGGVISLGKNWGNMYLLPLPKVFDYRVWPIAYIVLGALLYYRPEGLIPVATKLGWTLLWIVGVLAAMVAILALYFYVADIFEKEDDVPFAVEWLKAKYRGVCPYVEVK